MAMSEYERNNKNNKLMFARFGAENLSEACSVGGVVTSGLLRHRGHVSSASLSNKKLYFTLLRRDGRSKILNNEKMRCPYHELTCRQRSTVREILEYRSYSQTISPRCCARGVLSIVQFPVLA